MAEKRYIISETIDDFRKHLILEEKSRATVEKYIRDVKIFKEFISDSEVTKESVIEYKEYLQKQYSARSVNSMLASINSLFSFMDWHDIRVRAVRLQQQVFCSEEKELTRDEYTRLCKAAEKRHNERLALILQTICGTGIRVSKGKTRAVFIVKKLKRKLLRYAAAKNIKHGSIFITRTGRPVNRTNIWREMKSLCEEADVEPGKVFPHNLRHLFARVFYNIRKDIARLADILGHSSISTTRIYIISTGTEHRKCMENMHLII